MREPASCDRHQEPVSFGVGSEAPIAGESGGGGKGSPLRAVGEWCESVSRSGGIAAGAHQCFGDCTAALDQLDCPLEVTRPLIELFEGAMPRPVLLITAGQREQNGQGYLTIAKIVAYALAEFGFTRRKIEHIVDQLKCRAEIAAELVERLFLMDGSSGEDRPDAAGSSEYSAVFD